MLGGINISGGRAEAGCKYSSKPMRQGTRMKVPTLKSSFDDDKEAGNISHTKNITTASTGYVIVTK
jgi:hypothetical protein